MQETLFHQTDLFRPHNDPDDHWDLACAFAVARKGMVTLAGILIDYPPGPPVLNHASDPDIAAVAQLSHLTGIYPPIAVGNATYFSNRKDLQSSTAAAGVKFTIQVLRESPVPIVISIVGSARDIAEAIAREPQLFAEKCARIYLVSGSGSPDPASVPSLEWNVALDPGAYVQIFKAPCPIYWLPCLEDEDRVASQESRTYAGHFRFLEKDILDGLPDGLRSYFGFMYSRRDSSFWLRALAEDFGEQLHTQGESFRMMYSTPSFFDVAGQGVTTSGEIRPKTETRDDWVYRFEPVDVHCGPDGSTSWTASANANSSRQILRVLDKKAYPVAMTRAMRTLLRDAFTQSATSAARGQ
jgi:hypothetical protein